MSAVVFFWPGDVQTSVPLWREGLHLREAYEYSQYRPGTHLSISPHHKTPHQIKMGFRTGYVVTSMSFLFGVLFIASVYDFPLIYYTPFREEAAVAAEQFYLSAYNGPGAIHALLHGMMALGILGAVAKLHRWSETAKYFDGSCVGEYDGAAALR